MSLRWQVRLLWAALLLQTCWTGPGVEWSRVQYWLLSDRIRHLEGEVPSGFGPPSAWEDLARGTSEEFGSSMVGNHPRYLSQRPWVVRDLARLAAGTNLDDLSNWVQTPEETHEDPHIVFDLGFIFSPSSPRPGE